MNDIIVQNEKRQLDCNKRAAELYQRLSVAGENAHYMVEDLNSHKFRIFIAKIKLFFKKLRGEESVNGTDSSPYSGHGQGFFSSFKEVFMNKNKGGNNGVKTVEPVKRKSKSKSYIIALVLTCFPYTGVFGIHDFYLGNMQSGLLKLFTANLFGIGWILDVYRMITGSYPDM